MPPRLAFDAEFQPQAAAWQRALSASQKPCIAMKFDHGGNAAKAMPRATEIQLIEKALIAGWRGGS